MTHSVVIRAYNEERHIGKLLTGISRQNVKGLDVVLVDSGSTDATVDIARRFPVRVVPLKKEDFSFGHALNLGLEAAKGDIVVIASAHVYPTHDDWIEQLVAPFADDNVALTYGKQRGDENSHFSEQRIFERWFPDDGPSTLGYPFCNNANAAVRRTVWEGLPYNKQLTGLEDLEWAKRAVDQGYRIEYVPAAEVIHVHEETPVRIFHRYEREAIALRQIYPEQHFYLLDLLRLLPSSVVSDARRAIETKTPGEWGASLVDIARFRSMQYLGTFRGFHRRPVGAEELKATFYYPRPRARGLARDRVGPDAGSGEREVHRIEYGDLSNADRLG